MARFIIGLDLYFLKKSLGYAQLYIVDTENEVHNRISIFDKDRDCDDDNGVDKKIVEGLIRMFDESNEL
uniref:Uncharacterized protein n=1 Tax=Oryza rufipogon TaxID=4529 RepID=A0A0E0RFR4_ORYRU